MNVEMRIIAKTILNFIAVGPLDLKESHRE
jgi:hypothetical protein